MLFAFVLVITACTCSLVSSSTLQTCSNTGDDLNCTSKIVVSLTLESKQLNSTETLQFSVNTVTNSTQNLTLETPINISFSKSAVLTQYVLTYIQDYSYYAYEEIIYESILGCSDSLDESKATCGVGKYYNGTVIPDSQGFCCSCNISEILGITETVNRGKDCGSFNMGTGASSAHCLRFNELTYSSYDIGTFQYNYNITASIGANATITLSPQLLSSMSNKVKVKILGDLYPTSPPPTLSDKILVVPTSPPNYSKVLEGYTAWMIISPDKFTQDGINCDKIGVGYTAFKYQGDKCRVPAGTCLTNQIKDLYELDMNRLGNNQSLLYMLAKYGKYAIVTTANNTVYLTYEFKGVHTTMVNVEIAADSVKFITNVANADILYVNITTFEAMSSTGKALVVINNTGKVAANFYIGIVNCTNGLMDVAAVTASVQSCTNYIAEFKISTNYEKAKNYTCTAYVSNSLGEITDTMLFNFSTTDKVIVNYQNGTNSTSNGTTITSEDGGKTCSESCSWYNIICFIFIGCTAEILKLAIYVVAIILGVKIIIFVICKKKCNKKPQGNPTEAYCTNSQIQYPIEAAEKPARKYSYPAIKTTSCYYNFGYRNDIVVIMNCSEFSVECALEQSDGEFSDVQFHNPYFNKVLQRIQSAVGADWLNSVILKGIHGSCLSQLPSHEEFNEPMYYACINSINQLA